MGVHGLWDLLAPVGRRVSVETLAGKKLAIDASIWMIQFMKAMRDEKGEMIRNAHLVGFFRRICKLLFLRTKPVFVFDGGTPALKRRTVIARRRQRENAQTKIRKTAEKLLLNQLKTMRLKELQEDLRNQRQKNDAKGKKVIVDAKVEKKGKAVVEEQISREHTSEETNTFPANYNQEELDEMLAASIAAEEGGNFAADASTSVGGIPPEEEDADDEDEEMLLPAMHGQVDPAVLAALPPSMQLDLLVQMRERLMAENRQRYQKVKKAPAKFSELQIQAYLKTVAFRREIHKVQNSAAGKGIGGVQTSRIASESNREFIFSSSFTGDKQVLTSGEEGKTATHQSQTPSANVSSNAVNGVPSITISDHTAQSFQDDAGRVLPDDVETYQDDRGRIRVSKVRAMGIRMTRDLQRNLDLMKEIEQDGVVTGKIANTDASTDPTIIDVPGSSINNIPVSHTDNQNNDGMSDRNDNVEDSALKSGASIEISFETNAVKKSGDDDDLFALLVAGESMMDSSIGNSLTKEQLVESDSDCEWEEGIVQGKVSSLGNDSRMKPALDAGDICDDSGVEWEEGCSNIFEEASSCPAECNGPLSKGTLEEQAEFQEAIRRSLEDLADPRISDISCENLEHEERVCMGTISVNHEKDVLETENTAKNIYQPQESPSEAQANIRTLNSQDELDILPACDNSQLAPVLGVNPAHMELLTENAPSEEEVNVILHGEVHVKSDTHLGEKNACLIKEKLQDTSNNKIDASMGTTVSSDISNEELRDSTLSNVQQKELEASLDGNYNVVIPRNTYLNDTANDTDLSCKSSQEQGHNELLLDSKQSSNSALMDCKDEQVQVSEAGLEEQLLVLDEEYKQLGNEQKRLERNAESVSSEMFAECQELLQMFGLPYIVAPMEAEAQCAFMELANIVDGVVTDDSDAFLFGARSVFKNIFDERKYVETYFMQDIENELGLDRDKLIRMALLLGSDYTEGVSGIGIVNAVEVISAFPEEDGLRKFREWIESPDPAILGKFDAQEGYGSSKRGSKVGGVDRNSKLGVTACDQGVSQSEDEFQKLKQIFMEKHRNVSKNWHIPSTFPSDAVTSAYASPQVDNSTEPFAWGKPDLFALRKMCWEKFGWGNKKTDEVLLPVLKEYDKHETQLRLEAFYMFNEKFAKIRSKRIKSTIKGIKGNKSLEKMDDSLGDVPKSKKKRRANPSEADTDKGEVEKSSSVLEPGGVGLNTVKIKKQSNKRKSQPEVEGSNSKPAREANIRGTGRGRSQCTRQQKRKKSSLKNDEASSDDELNSEGEETAEVEFEEPHQVRRSGRARKVVDYSMNPSEADEHDSNSPRHATTEKTSRDQVIVGNSSSGANEKYKNESGDIGKEYSRDFLEVGSEFVNRGTEQNMETGQLKFDQSDNSLSEAQFSKEYLNMGGGFCLDDEEADGNSGRCPSSPDQTMMFADAEVSDCSVPAEEENQESDSIQLPLSPTLKLNEQRNRKPDASETEENASGFTCLQEDTVNDDLKTDTLRPLRAMPNLRRRKKK